MIARLITEMITWLGFFCAAFLAYYYFLRFRNTERMSLIEKGVDVSEIFKKRDRVLIPWYMIGFLLLGIGFGTIVAIIGYNLCEDIINSYEQIMVIGCMLIFGALGIILGHHLEQKKKI